MCIDYSQLLAVSVVLLSLGQASPTPWGNDTKDLARYAKSAEIRNYMNESHDPCQDFYTFSCGHYYRINPPISSPFQTNMFHTIAKSLSRKFAKLLQADEGTDSPTDKKVKKFYESCMQARTYMKNYRTKIIEIISEFGQMPVLAGAAWREDDFDWVQTVGQIAHKYDKRIIVGNLIEVDTANNTVNRLHILMQNMPLESASIYFFDMHKRFRNFHKRSIAKTLRDFLNVDKKLAETTANEIFEFETKLFMGYNFTTEAELTAVNVTDTADDDPNTQEVAKDDPGAVQNLTTIEEMQTKYFPKLDIKRLLNISLGEMPTDPVYDFLEEEVVDNIALVMANTPKRVVANYIFYHLVSEFELDIPDKQSELVDLCVETTKSHFAKVLDNMVYRSYATNQTEADVEHMWQTIKTTFHHLLQSDKLSWMQLDTRKYALEKLKTIHMEINSYQQANFTEEFGPLALSDRDYIGNVKAIFALRGLRSRAKLREPPKPYDDANTLSFTPVYITTENLIKVPVSVLQPFYLWSDWYPNALKFGTLGFLIAHELIHAFDEEGRTYDVSGNKHAWWDKDSNDYFDNHTQCFNAQYTKYVYGGHPLPELNTQSENIADNGGIRLAYDAYLRWYEEAWRTHRKLDLETMPRLNYTSKQLFFISYGQLWCSATHPALRNYEASTDDHVPGKYRVIGPLANLEEFSKEFNCPAGSVMNPKDKCIIY